MTDEIKPDENVPESAENDKSSQEPEDEKVKRRRDWQRNNREIAKAILDFYKEHGKSPTNAELAKLTGISERAIQNHFDELDFADIFESGRRKMATMAEPAFLAILNSAVKGSAKSQDLFMQIVMGWIPKRELDANLRFDEIKEEWKRTLFPEKGGDDESSSSGEQSQDVQEPGGDSLPPSAGAS